MIASKSAAAIRTQMDTWIANHGDKLWELLCDEMPINKPFTIAQAAKKLNLAVSERSARESIRAVLLSVEAQGNNVVKRLGNSWTL